MPANISSLVDAIGNGLLLNVLLVVDHCLDLLEFYDTVFTWHSLAASATTSTMAHVCEAMLVLLNNLLDEGKWNHGCRSKITNL